MIEEEKEPKHMGLMSYESRLLLSAEIFILNSVPLLSDLSSAKYALLTFTEKFKNEVKQKSLLIPAVNDAYREFLESRKLVVNERRKLTELETKLVSSSSVPRFVLLKDNDCSSNLDVLSASGLCRGDAHGEKEDSRKMEEEEELVVNWQYMTSPAALSTAQPYGVMSSSNCGATGSRAHDTNSADGVAAMLSPEDMERVQKARLLFEEEREQLISLARESNLMESQLEMDKSKCDAIRKRIEELELKCKEASDKIFALKNEQQLCNILQLELGGRRCIYEESQDEMGKLFCSYKSERAAVAERSFRTTQESIAKIRRELDEKKNSNEIELVVYQIACKEQQAAAGELKDAISSLHSHQRGLELLAKQQEIRMSRGKTCSRGLFSFLRLSPNSSEDTLPVLTTEHINEVQNESRDVSILATRIGVMKTRKKVLAAQLLRLSKTNSDVTEIKCVLQRMLNLLTEEIVIDEADLQDYEGT